MSNDDFFGKLQRIEADSMSIETYSNEHEQLIDEHRNWLKMIRRERPSKARHFKVAIYIRYFNQTKYDNYLEYHKKQFLDALSLVPNWSFVGFYIDEGMTAPNMETAAEWSRLLEDSFDGKVDLIITQKISNVSKKISEITWCARLLAAQENPIGIYFVSEDIFTLATYYMDDILFQIPACLCRAVQCCEAFKTEVSLCCCPSWLLSCQGARELINPSHG